jgi:hypothetical protein
VSAPVKPLLPAGRDRVAGLHRLASRRTLWHTIGLLVALALAWLVLRGYRQPEFIIDFMNMRLC